MQTEQHGDRYKVVEGDVILEVCATYRDAISVESVSENHTADFEAWMGK